MVQSFMLTEVRDCDLPIVVTSSTILKRKDMWSVCVHVSISFFLKYTRTMCHGELILCMVV